GWRLMELLKRSRLDEFAWLGSGNPPFGNRRGQDGPGDCPEITAPGGEAQERRDGRQSHQKESRASRDVARIRGSRADRGQNDSIQASDQQNLPDGMKQHPTKSFDDRHDFSRGFWVSSARALSQ